MALTTLDVPALVTILSTPACAPNIDRTFSQYRLDAREMRDGLPGYDIMSLAQTSNGFGNRGRAMAVAARHRQLRRRHDLFAGDVVVRPHRRADSVLYKSKRAGHNRVSRA